ncbi:mitotic interactor and substrate of PLK1 [Pseudophryne corroboree]|uniref:mitotic interactor and substrate of PLK1 n=1 Tax=Pseudophryne corroboree TaxID=495146 RepID=UPI0030818413
MMLECGASIDIWPQHVSEKPINNESIKDIRQQSLITHILLVQCRVHGYRTETQVSQEWKVLVDGEGGSQNQIPSELLIENSDEKYVTNPSEFQLLVSSEYQDINSSDTESTKGIETEVLEAPRLTVVESEALTKANEERNYISEEQQPNITSTSPVSTMDRVTRSMIFSLSSAKSIDGSNEDLVNSTTEEIQVTEKIKKSWDVWVPPPDRNSRLKLLREEEQFEIRTHRPENSPTKLFADSDGEEDDDKVKLRSSNFTPEKAWELEKERRDIIRKQCQRKSLDTEDLIAIQDEINASGLDKDLNGVGTDHNAADIDTEQINFAAARQQFLMLEKERNSLPITPRLHSRSFRLSSYSLYENDGCLNITNPIQKEQDVKPQKEKSYVTQEKTGVDARPNLLRKQFFRELSVDSVDAEEEGKPREIYRDMNTPETPEVEESIPNPSDETPIEREIRLAMQREESLRKERGIQSLGETKEMVEILKNPVLSISSDTQLSKKVKVRARTSFFLQREIDKEVQREADLKSEGKVAGLYDKGNAQELDERRKLFEQPDEIPVQPHKGTTKIISTMITGNTKENSDQTELEQNSELKNATVLDAPQPYSVRTKWKPKLLNTYRNRRLSADNILDIKIPTETSSEKETSVETFVLCKENFPVQPSSFQPLVQEDQQKDENDQKKEVISESYSRSKLYSTRLRPSLYNVIEQEIQKSLERDRELQEQRRKTDVSPGTIPPSINPITPHNGYNQYDRPSLTPDAPRPLSSARWRETPGRLSPVQMFKPKSYPKFVDFESDAARLRRRDNWYAGIDPTDAVNTEIVASTRVIRHKNTLALRWEAGQYSNEPHD